MSINKLDSSSLELTMEDKCNYLRKWELTSNKTLHHILPGKWFSAGDSQGFGCLKAGENVMVEEELSLMGGGAGTWEKWGGRDLREIGGTGTWEKWGGRDLGEMGGQGPGRNGGDRDLGEMGGPGTWEKWGGRGLGEMGGQGPGRNGGAGT